MTSDHFEITYENTSDLYELVQRGGKAYGEAVFLRWEAEGTIHERTFGDFCRAVHDTDPDADHNTDTDDYADDHPDADDYADDNPDAEQSAREASDSSRYRRPYPCSGNDSGVCGISGCCDRSDVYADSKKESGKELKDINSKTF